MPAVPNRKLSYGEILENERIAKKSAINDTKRRQYKGSKQYSTYGFKPKPKAGKS